MKHAVLITGASGLIGRRLTTALLQKGCRVSHLGRTARPGDVPSYVWNPEKDFIDPRAFDGIDTLVHLAGAGVGDKRWTPTRKREILESRVKSTALLVNFLNSHPNNIKTVIAASAVGYYGFGPSSQEFTEDSPAGKDFLSSVVVRWEQETERFRDPGYRLVKPRIGVVLSDEGGALAEIVRPIRWGIGAPLGDGEQLMSWIHIDDLCELFVYAMDHPEVEGVYNAVAPAVTSNRELTKAIAARLRRKILLPAVPAFVLRALLGEMADLVIKGSKVSAGRILRSGFQFRFGRLEDALDDLLP